MGLRDGNAVDEGVSFLLVKSLVTRTSLGDTEPEPVRLSARNDKKN
jgi:hypothetical protein